jgi:hypothetical protein
MAWMTELDEGGARWTEEARESFRTAAENLVEAIRRQSAALLELDGVTSVEAVDELIGEADELLEEAASAYADAQYELTGTVPPLGLDEDLEYLDHELDEDLAEDSDEDLGEDEAVGAEDARGEDPGNERELSGTGVPDLKLTVLHRADFVVIDELAVIQAGKEAYHEAFDPSDEHEAVDVSDVGEALQQLRQAGGIDALAEAPGLASAGATTWILEATELLDERDLEEWPTFPFAPGEDAQQRLLLRVDETAG